MKSRERKLYASPEVEAMEIELRSAVLQNSGYGDTEGMQDALGGTDWSEYYNYNN